MVLAKIIAAAVVIEAAVLCAGVATYLALSDTIGGAAIAAVASVVNTVLIVRNRRAASRELKRTLGDPDDEKGDTGTALHELSAIRDELADARELLEATNRARERIRRDALEEPRK
jgi:hypothetical protein